MFEKAADDLLAAKSQLLKNSKGRGRHEVRSCIVKASKWLLQTKRPRP